MVQGINDPDLFFFQTVVHLLQILLYQLFKFFVLVPDQDLTFLNKVNSVFQVMQSYMVISDHLKYPMKHMPLCCRVKMSLRYQK